MARGQTPKWQREAVKDRKEMGMKPVKSTAVGKNSWRKKAKVKK